MIGDRVEQQIETAPRRHADLILGMLDALLQKAGLQLTELDAIAYGRGPGSFTGVRIAAAVAQGVAFGAGRPVIGVSTLAAVARAAFRQTGRRQIACALDARMGEVYWGCYQIASTSGADEALLIDQEVVITPERTPALAGADWSAAGSGWSAYPELLDRHRGALQTVAVQTETAQTDAGEPAEVDPTPSIIEYAPEAQDIAWLARSTFDQAQRPDRAIPVYLRNRVTAVRRKLAGSS